MTSPTQSAWPDAPVSGAPDSSASTPSTGADRPGRKLGILRIALLVLATLVLLAIAAAGITAIALYGDYAAQYPARFGAPTRIGTLVHTSDPTLRAGETEVVAQLRKTGLKQPFAAFYEDEADGQHGIFLAGSTQRVLLPRFEVAGAFHTIQGDGITVNNLERVDAGKPGGTVQCGTSKADGANSVICAWADHGSIGVLRLPNRTVKEATVVVREVRTAAIIRG
ncbi:MAG: hypothetical protein QOJ50_2311 [Cryptosporangiaceae bacterium]|jgi:hypothetical protein|nr:hypothetical protein [Cryptosporangiaceae bacterium]